MTITNTLVQGERVHRYASGKFTFSEAGEDPTTLVKTLGWTPRYVAFHNVTDRISYEWFHGLAATESLKTVAAGTRTLDTADAAISVSESAGTVTFSAAAIIEDKVCYWVACG